MQLKGLYFVYDLNRQVVPPDFLRDIDLETKLRPLLLLREVVPLGRRAESALMTQTQLVESSGAERGRLAQPTDDLGAVVERGPLAGHDAEDDDLVRREVAQRGEVAGARVVVLEEVDVDVELLEQDLGDGLVAALREPPRPVVAAADVDADGHVGGPAGYGGVDERGVPAGQGVGVAAVAPLGLGAHLGVAEVGEVGVVELHEAAARGVQVGELLLEHAREVGEEGLQRRVGRLVDGVAGVAEVDHGRRGDADLCRRLALALVFTLSLAITLALAVVVDMRLEKAEVVDLDGRRVRQLADDDEPRRHGAADADVGRLHGAPLLDAREVPQEVHVEPAPAELAVRHGAEADGLLLPHHVRDVLVLERPELRGRDLALGRVVAGREEGLGP